MKTSCLQTCAVDDEAIVKYQVTHRKRKPGWELDRNPLFMPKRPRIISDDYEALVKHGKRQMEPWMVFLEENVMLTKIIDGVTKPIPFSFKQRRHRQRRNGSRSFGGVTGVTSNDKYDDLEEGEIPPMESFKNPSMSNKLAKLIGSDRKLQDICNRRYGYMFRARMQEQITLSPNHKIAQTDKETNTSLGTVKARPCNADCKALLGLSPTYLKYFKNADGSRMFPDHLCACGTKNNGQETLQAEFEGSSQEPKERGVKQGLIEVMMLKLLFGKTMHLDGGFRSVCHGCGRECAYYCASHEKYNLHKVVASDRWFAKGSLSPTCVNNALSHCIVQTHNIQTLFGEALFHENTRTPSAHMEIKGCLNIQAVLEHVSSMVGFFFLSPMHIMFEAGNIKPYDLFLVELNRRLAIQKTYRSKNQRCSYGSRHLLDKKLHKILSKRLFNFASKISDRFTVAKLVEDFEGFLNVGLDLNYMVCKYFDERNRACSITDVFLPRKERNAKDVMLFDNLSKNSDTLDGSSVTCMRLLMNIHENICFDMVGTKALTRDNSAKVKAKAKETMQYFGKSCFRCKSGTITIHSEVEDVEDTSFLQKTLQRFLKGNLNNQWHNNNNSNSNSNDKPYNPTPTTSDEFAPNKLRYARKESSIIVQTSYGDRLTLLGQVLHLITGFYFEKVKERTRVVDNALGKGPGTKWMLSTMKELDIALFMSVFRVLSMFCDFLSVAEHEILREIAKVPLETQCGEPYHVRLHQTVFGLRHEYINLVTEDNVNVVTNTNWFDNAGVGCDELTFNACSEFGLDPIYYMSKRDPHSKVDSIFI